MPAIATVAAATVAERTADNRPWCGVRLGGLMTKECNTPAASSAISHNVARSGEAVEHTSLPTAQDQRGREGIHDAENQSRSDEHAQTGVHMGASGYQEQAANEAIRAFTVR